MTENRNRNARHRIGKSNWKETIYHTPSPKFRCESKDKDCTDFEKVRQKVTEEQLFIQTDKDILKLATKSLDHWGAVCIGLEKLTTSTPGKASLGLLIQVGSLELNFEKLLIFMQFSCVVPREISCKKVSCLNNIILK